MRRFRLTYKFETRRVFCNSPVTLAGDSRAADSRRTPTQEQQGIRMKTGSLKLLAPIVLLSFLSTTHAAVIDFDDIDASAGDVLLDNYKTYTWSNILAYTATDGFPGFNNGILSPSNGAYSGGELGGAPAAPIVGTISSTTAFG